MYTVYCQLQQISSISPALRIALSSRAKSRASVTPKSRSQFATCVDSVEDSRNIGFFNVSHRATTREFPNDALRRQRPIGPSQSASVEGRNASATSSNRRLWTFILYHVHILTDRHRSYELEMKVLYQIVAVLSTNIQVRNDEQ